MENMLPVFAVSRLRMATDGKGVTTLVGVHGCPLQCKYCLNAARLKPEQPVTYYTPQALLDAVRVDGLYFSATGGGITFGGGEPLLHAPFLAAFKALMPVDWTLTAETSLHIPRPQLLTAAKCVDQFIIDIKDMDDGIYRAYTGREPLRENLMALKDLAGQERMHIRIPRIPGYNTAVHQQRSAEVLQKLGFTRLETFDYIIR